MDLPVDRLDRAGAYRTEITHLQNLTVPERDGVITHLASLDDAGVRHWLRARRHKPEVEVQTEAKKPEAKAK